MDGSFRNRVPNSAFTVLAFQLPPETAASSGTKKTAIEMRVLYTWLTKLESNIHRCPMYAWPLICYFYLIRSASRSCSSSSGTSARWRRRRWSSTSTYREGDGTGCEAHLPSLPRFLISAKAHSAWVGETRRLLDGLLPFVLLVPGCNIAPALITR